MSRIVLPVVAVLAMLAVAAGGGTRSPASSTNPAAPSGVAGEPAPTSPRVLPLSAPVVPEVFERQAAIEASGRYPVARGRMVLDGLNREFELGLSTTQLEEMGKRLDEELYPRLGWAVDDIPTLFDEVNRFLGLAIEAKELEDYGLVLQEELEGPPREFHVDRRSEEEVLWWDDTANTSPNLTGSTIALAVLLEVPAGFEWDNSWPWYDISTACGRVGDAMKFYKNRAPAQADVSYEVRHFRTTVSTSVADDRGCEKDWMEEAFNNLGYYDGDADGTVLDDVARHFRDLYEKDNCIIFFVPLQGGRSYACRGGYNTHAGPVTTLFYYWIYPIQEGWTTYAHEAGHLFGACDEYYQSSDKTGCDYNDPANTSGEGCDDPCKLTEAPFKPWALNENCEKCNDDAVDCIMNLNSKKICTHTKRQFGWHDHDGDGVIDALDAAPSDIGPVCNDGAPEQTPPDSRVAGLADHQSSDSTFTVYWAGTDECGGVASYDVEYKIAGGGWTSWMSAVTSTSAPFSGSDFHTYYFRSRARDGYDNEEDWPLVPDAMTTTMAGMPPAPETSSSTHGDESTWYDDNDPRFSWIVPLESDLPLEDIIPSFSWDVTRGAADVPDDTYDGPIPTTSYTNLADGTWWFHVKAKDWTGTWGHPGHRRLRIDTSPPPAPVITSDTHPTSTIWYNNPTLSVEWTVPPDSAGISGYSLEGPDQNPYTVPPESQSHTSTSTYFYDLPTGVWYVHVRAVDNLGHWGATGHLEVRVDRTPPPPPTVTSATHPIDGNWYSNNDPSFFWYAPIDDSGISGFSYLESPWPGSIPDHNSQGTFPSTTYVDVGEGQGYFHIISRDNAVPPNWSTDVTHFGYGVDTVIPGGVSGLVSTSHDSAIGRWDNPQSSDNTVEVRWTPADDPSPGGGVGGYSIEWDHAAATLPDQFAELEDTTTGITSAGLADRTDHYFHIRSRDAAGNWDTTAVHLGPFYVNTAPPAVPSGFWATPGISRVDLDWADNSDPDFAGYHVYRSTSAGSGYVKLNPTPIFTSLYADLAVLNGIEYYYVVTATDSVGNESDHSVERHGMPEYETPATGVSYTLAQLVPISNHGIVGGGGVYTMNGSVTISGPDTLTLSPGEVLRSSDAEGVRKLLVNGTLLADGGGVGGRVTFGSTGTGRGRWGGIELPAGNGGGVMDSCLVEGAVTGIRWSGPAVSITSCEVRDNSGTGIRVRTLPDSVCTVRWNHVHGNGGDGIYLLGDASDTISVTDNAVEHNGGDGIRYTVYGAAPPTYFSISDNSILNNTGAGVACGQGTGAVLIMDNDIRENADGIALAGEAWGARPTIRFNNIQANRQAGIRCITQAMPFVDSNTIVGNLGYGLYCSSYAEPVLVNNTITGSQYGVYLTQYTAAPVADLGSAANQSGQNRIHGHSSYSVYNNTPFGVRAQGNWWGTAATLAMAANPPPPALGDVIEIWDLFDQPGLGLVDYWSWAGQADSIPTITITSPAAGPIATVDTSFVVTWTDSDPEGDAQINLYYDVDAMDLDGLPLEGGSGLSEDDPADSLVWNTRSTPRGTYSVYGVIDDGYTNAFGYSAGQVTVDHAAIAVAPDTVDLVMTANAVHEEPVTVSNLSDNYALHFEALVTDTTGAEVVWATATPDTGTVAPGDSAEVLLRVETDGLGSGTYVAHVRFESNDPLDSLVVTPVVELEVAYPVAALGDTTHDFGVRPLGPQALWDFTVFNTGTAALWVNDITATDNAYSVLGASLPEQVAQGDSVIYTLRYATADPGWHPATVSLATDAPYDSTLVIAVQGFGLGPDISLSEATHAFGAHAYGDSTIWELMISNAGNDSLRAASVTSNHSDYRVVSPAFPDTLAPDEMVTVTVRHRALAEGPTAATLTVISNDPDEAVRVVSVNGAVNKPEVAVVPSSHAFGTVRVDADALGGFMVRNTGTGDLSIHEITGDNPDYAWSGAVLPDTLAPADSLPVTVTFTPFADGASNGSLWLRTDDAETPLVEVVLTGAGGVPAFEADSTGSFGEVFVGDQGDRDVELHNVGTVDVRVDSVAVSDVAYGVVGAPPVAIAAGDSALITVRFAPASPDSFPATLTVYSDDPTHPQVWVTLSGLGVEPDLELSATSHNFGEVLLGSHADWTLYVVNRGNYDLDVMQCAPDSAVYSVVSPAFPQVIDPGESLHVVVRLTPDDEEVATGALHLQSGDPTDSVLVVPLVGSGVWPDLYRSPYALTAVVFEEESSSPPFDLRNVGTGALDFTLAEQDTVIEAAALERTLSKLGSFNPDPGDVTAAAGDVSWLSVAPSGGTLHMGEAVEVDVVCSAAGKSHGVYKAAVKVESSEPDSAVVWEPVKMRVPRMRFADHDAGNVVFTVTDEGCYGFYDYEHELLYADGLYGSGFQIKGAERALFSGCLWVGTADSVVADGSYDFDWEVAPGGALALRDLHAQLSRAEFTDSNAPIPHGLSVSQFSMGLADPPDDDYVRLEYTIRNTGPDSLVGVCAGLYLDWDIQGAENDAGGYSADEGLGYMYEASAPAGPHYGVCMLEPMTPSAFHSIHNPTHVYPYGDIPDNVAYGFLSDGTVDTSATPEDTDWSQVMAWGPHTLAAGDSLTVAFAVLAGDNLSDLRTNATRARARFPVGINTLSVACAVADGHVEIAWMGEQFHEFDLLRAVETPREFHRVNPEPITCSSDCVFIDRDVEPGGTYFYRLTSAGMLLAGPLEVRIPGPQVTRMLANYPNPFGASTTLRFVLAEPAEVTVEIFDLRGRRVRTLGQGPFEKGQTDLTWDGRTDAGREAASGIYFCRFTVGEHRTSRKMVLLK